MKKAIIGLGNPGVRYTQTRHNVGKNIVQFIADHHAVYSWQTSPTAEYTQIAWGGHNVFLVKPLVYMNESGKVIPFLMKKGLKADQLLVIHDELELAFGKVKLKFGGSARGHNGLRSIINIIGKDFYRLACGIGRPHDGQDVAQYVLAPFAQSEQGALSDIFDLSYKRIEDEFISLDE